MTCRHAHRDPHERGRHPTVAFSAHPRLAGVEASDKSRSTRPVLSQQPSSSAALASRTRRNPLMGAELVAAASVIDCFILGRDLVTPTPLEDAKPFPKHRLGPEWSQDIGLCLVAAHPVYPGLHILLCPSYPFSESSMSLSLPQPATIAEMSCGS